MPPKGRTRPAKETSIRPAKRPVSPLETPTPAVKRIKVEPDQTESFIAGSHRPTRISKIAPLETITEETEGEDVDLRDYDYVEPRVDGSQSPEHETIAASEDDRVNIAQLVDLESTESPGGVAVDDEAEEDNSISWDESDNEDATRPAPSKRRRILDQIIKGHPDLLEYVLGKHKHVDKLEDAKAKSTTEISDRGIRPPVPARLAAHPGTRKRARDVEDSPRTKIILVESTPPPPASPRTNDPFDGSVSVLNADLWPPSLRKMYLKVRPPRRRVTFMGRAEGADPDTPPLHRWISSPRHSALFRKVLEFECNGSYFNLARGKSSELRVVDTQNVTRPLRYIGSKDSNTPRLIISIVETVQCNLIRPVKIARKNNDGWLDKKALIANWFSQEFELNLCNLGDPLDANSITLPCWSNRDELCGLTFQTRLANSDGPMTAKKRAGSKKSSLYAPEAAALSGSKVPIQLFANQTVPLIDATSNGIDLSMPFAELKQLPTMRSEAPPGSLGCVFYTITDSGDHTPVDFNIQAFALLATTPDADEDVV